MRRNWGVGAVVVLGIAVSSTRMSAPLEAQTLGETSAASSMGSTLDSGGGGMSTSASSYLRGLPPSSGIPGGSDPTNFNDAARGGSNGSSGGSSPSSPSGFPNANAPGGAGAGNAAAVIPEEPFHWSDMRGIDFVRELQSHGTLRRPYYGARLRRAPYRRPIAKYPLPPRGWLSYYVQSDRYKFATHAWNFVTIEDDRGEYPVRYYYRPNSPEMLRLLATSPRAIRRFNRVVGFKSWQDAMIAGLRPDPVSKPEPAPRVLQLASLTHSDGAMRFIEAAYAGQMSPQQFDSSVDYVSSVARAVRSRRETRSLTSRTVNRVVLALLGEGPFPTTVIGTRSRIVLVPAVTTPTTGAPGMQGGSGAPGMSGAPGTPSSYPPPGAINPTNPDAPTNGSGQEPRMGTYNRFQQNAASLNR